MLRTWLWNNSREIGKTIGFISGAYSAWKAAEFVEKSNFSVQVGRMGSSEKESSVSTSEKKSSPRKK
jgi:hypothetical protein